MIKALNNISGVIVRLVALLWVNFSMNFGIKFLLIKEEIEIVNKKQIDLPKILVSTVVEIEDKRYFQHLGVDFYSIIRAIYKNIATSRIEGASTIVQQLIRNIINEREIKASRKIKEIMLAALIDKKFSKTEIMFAYLETYNFGNCKGLVELCKKENYNIDTLSDMESAEIAARLKYPSICKSNYIKYLKRVRTIEVITSIQEKSLQPKSEEKEVSTLALNIKSN